MDTGTDAHRRKDEVRQSRAPALTGARRNILLACLALLAALALAAPADAGIGKYRLGVVTGPPPGVGDLDRLRNARVRSIKMIFSWDALETKRRTGKSCATAEYEGLGRYSTEIIKASRRGIRILPYIIDAPGYAGGGSHMPKTGTRAFGDYKCFLRALVRSFGRGGRLLREEPSAKPIIEWQLWNEPNLPIYAAGGNPNPREYARFVKASSGVINRVDRKATIVLGGMPEKSLRGMSSKKFLTRFYKVKGIKKKFDVVALHPFAKNARGTKGALIRLRDLLRRVGDRRQVIWITEIGYATHGPKGQFLVTTEKGQARKTQSTLSFLKKNHKRYNVGTVDWFRWRDEATYAQNTGHWWDYAGLYRKDGTPKPACHRYRRFTGAGGKCKRIVDNEQQSASILEVPDARAPAASTGLIPSRPD